MKLAGLVGLALGQLGAAQVALGLAVGTLLGGVAAHGAAGRRPGAGRVGRPVRPVARARRARRRLLSHYARVNVRTTPADRCLYVGIPSRPDRRTVEEVSKTPASTY
ncbi:hypothetical protein [Clavibacter zhangzhiyongii]|uniref:hypothetical protein n=1 Tax=Clavibacter zhangzhiyongii TaxID=2768071 RepID=UPI0039E0EB58